LQAVQIGGYLALGVANTKSIVIPAIDH
jgi:hypothetical protein